MYLALQRYSRPSTVHECLELLHAQGGRAALLSGGTDLNAREHEALTHVIDLQALPLAEVRASADSLRLGARVTLARLRREPALARPELAALREAAGAYAVVALQNRATLGGRIMVDRGTEDLPTALVALGAELELARRVDGQIVTEREPYPVGQRARAALEGALVCAVVLPLGTGRSALRRFGRTAVDQPLASVAAASRAGAIHLAANVQGPGAADLRTLPRSEALASAWLAGRPADWRAQARVALLGELAACEDPWASGDYRRDLSATLGVRALAAVFGEPEIV
ncbi:MAG: FAD binding domain-containing protein [Myxococcales bacterium]|nr:FAD binding domain-containing protein [Myxococcales bacterium]